MKETTMERLGNWLSPNVMHALGWALIHSLWQCLGIAALAAVLMAFSRRPSVRYLVGVGALSLLLAVPVATFFISMKPVAPVQALHPADASLAASSPSAGAGADPIAVISNVMGNRTIASITDTPREPLLPNVLPWLVGAWLCGVTLLSLRLAGGFLLLEHRRRSRTAALSPAILAICHEVQHQLGLDRVIQYLQCSWLQAPAVIGWLRPVVVLPVQALTGLSEVELRAVIAHELSHIRRLDAFVNLFQVLVETLLFYHPGVWWLNKRIRAERELCCDDVAISLTGNRLEYARALARIAEWKDAPFLAMAANRGSLSERILHILGRKPVGAGQRMLGLTGSVLFLVAALGAANALFGIAYTIPAAHAKASIKAVLVSSQAAVHEIAQQALKTGEPAAKDSTPIPVARVAPKSTLPDQSETATNSKPEKLVVPSPNLSRLELTKPLAIPAGTTAAANDHSVAPAQSAAQTLPDVPNTTGLLPYLIPFVDGRPGPLVAASRNELSTEYICYNSSVTGHVLSTRAILIDSFVCKIHGVYSGAIGEQSYSGFIMNVELGRSSDAERMAHGTTVTIGGNFKVLSKHHVRYLVADNAKVLAVDPPAQSAPDQHASNDAPAVALNDQPVGPIQPTTRDLPVGPVQAGLSTPPATPPNFDPNKAYKIRRCTGTGTGRVTSSTTIQMPQYDCLDGWGLDRYGNPSGAMGADGGGIFHGNDGPCKNHQVSWIPSLIWGRYCPTAPWPTVTVQLANPSDASRMPLGKLVKLKGDFRVITQNKVSYLLVQNARVLYVDPFGR
jgi:beta-lactamase regulating signal transducer with metallopeptidase domain